MNILIKHENQQNYKIMYVSKFYIAYTEKYISGTPVPVDGRHLVVCNYEKALPHAMKHTQHKEKGYLARGWRELFECIYFITLGHLNHIIVCVKGIMLHINIESYKYLPVILLSGRHLLQPSAPM